MKIVAGLGSIDDYEVLAKAGADEVFCGFVPLIWNERYGNILPLNRREVFFYHVQIGTYSEMRILKKMMDELQVPVTITFNSLYYIEEQLPIIAEMMGELSRIGFRDYIIADLGLLLYLVHNEDKYFSDTDVICNIHFSGELGEWNHNTIELMMSQAKSVKVKISRIIFHRKNTVEDMKSCIDYSKKYGLEYEAFAMNEMCHFTGGFCNSLHCDELSHICQLPYHVVHYNDKSKQLEQADKEYGAEPGSTGCGLCALWKLRKSGVTHLKVVGRGKCAEGMAEDIKAIRKALDILESSICEAAYIEQIITMLFDGECSNSCYYLVSEQ